MSINISKLRFVDFIKESTSSVSVKFTFKTSIIEMRAILIIVAQDARFGEYIAFKLTDDRGSNLDQNIYKVCFKKWTLF